MTFRKLLTVTIAATLVPAIATASNIGFDERPAKTGFYDSISPTESKVVTTSLSFSGIAKVESPVHEWISRSAGRDFGYAIPYEINYIDNEQGVQFTDVTDFVSWVGMPGATNGFTTERFTSESPWDPEQSIPMPDSDGNPGDVNSGCTVTAFGFPPRMARVEYTWKWLLQDTNRNGVQDNGEEYGWQLVSYAVNFPEDVRTLPQC